MINLEKHFVQQALFPEPDKERWLAFITLNKKYPEITYWSMDGYHCDALADYSKDIVWRDNEIVQWSTKERAWIVPDFHKTTSTEICRIWMDVCGETEQSKREWVRAL